jgi:hypothetical protein
MLYKPAEMEEEVDLSTIIKKDPTSSISYVKTPDTYKVEEYDDIERHFGKYVSLYKRHLEQEVQHDSLFKAYRNILDLQYFKDMKNPLVFWKDYTKQLYDQLPSNEQTKLWNTLQDMLNYHSKIHLPRQHRERFHFPDRKSQGAQRRCAVHASRAAADTGEQDFATLSSGWSVFPRALSRQADAEGSLDL